MKANRRNILQFLALAPIGGKKAAEEAAKKLAGMGDALMSQPPAWMAETLGLSNGLAPSASASLSSPGSADYGFVRKLREAALRAALNTATGRAEIESIMYEANRYVGSLDHDLAANRSYSLAAKVCYQRQRNVQRSIEHELFDETPWARMREWGNRVCSIAGIKL